MSAMPMAFRRYLGHFPRNKFRGYHIDHVYGIWILAGRSFMGRIFPGMNSRVTISTMPMVFGYWRVGFYRPEFILGEKNNINNTNAVGMTDMVTPEFIPGEMIVQQS